MLMQAGSGRILPARGQWKQHQREHGTAALLRDERGRKEGEKRLMSAEQEKEVRRLVTDKLPFLPAARDERELQKQIIGQNAS